MHVMVIVKATKNSEAGILPTQEILARMGKYNEELVKAGVMVTGEGLHPSSKGKRLRFSSGKATIVDGPFAETKELVAGFSIWRVSSMEEAVAWAERWPDCAPGGDYELELRPIYDVDDFGEAFTPELRAQKEHLRANVGRKPKG